MENFILYEEIGRGTNSIVYKGRRKGTITFLAILCIEKDARAAITNWVRLTHELKHDNIVKFQEWYETSNHLWMVMELCTGGTLQEVLDLDGCLPEETVRKFGQDILLGINYLHQHGIVFADISPKKILLDGPGTLKLTNFCVSRLKDENLAEVYMQAAGQYQEDVAEQLEGNILRGKLEYQPPEVLKSGSPSLAGDIWALGAVLYELYTGSVPFACENSADLVQQVCHGKLESPDKRRLATCLGRSMPGFTNEKPSSAFLDFLNLTLNKNPDLRPNAETLLEHPFWKTEKTVAIAAKPAVKPHPVPENIPPKSSPRPAPESVNVLDSTFTLSSRPLSAQPYDNDEHIQQASRAATPRASVPLGVTYSVTKKVARSSVTECDIKQRSLSATSTKEDNQPDSIKSLIYHSTDLELSAIQDNPQIKKVDPFRWDAKSLPFQALPSVDNVTSEDLYDHLKQVQQSFSQASGSNQQRIRSAVSSYLAHLCTCNTSVANFVINSSMLGLLASLVKSTMQQSPDVASKAARVIGLTASCATELEQCTKITEVFSTLNDVLRESFRTTRSKLSLLPCLGQLLLFVTEQDEGNPSVEVYQSRPASQPQTQKGNWSIPMATYNLISRCLREGEDPVVQHFACKTIECVAAIGTNHGKKFLNASMQGSGTTPSHSSDVIGTMLWTVSERATNETLKQCSLSAMCRLNRLSGNGAVLQGILDRVSLAPFLSSLSRSSYKCQQAIATALVETMYSAPKGHTARLANGKDILPNLMKLLDSPSSVVRAKIILAVTLLLKRNASLIMAACQNRLIMYVERDWRRLRTPSAGNRQTPSTSEYVCACLHHLIQHMVQHVPQISVNCISILDEASKRKHPSSQQIKQLKSTLPTLIVLHHLVTSQVFRSQVVTSDFVSHLSQLLSHVTNFLKRSGGSSHASGIATSVGDDIVQKFVDTVLSIVECLSQHSIVLTQHEDTSMKSLVPQLISLISFYGGGNGQIVCIKLLTDILGTLLNYSAISSDAFTAPDFPLTPRTPSSRGSSRSSVRSARSKRVDHPDAYGVRESIEKILIPDFQPILLANDPLPAYGVRFLGTILEHWPSISTSIHSCGLIPVLMTLFQEQHSAVLSTCAQGLVTVLTLLVRFADDDVTAQVYDNGFVDHLLSYLNDMSAQYLGKDIDGKMDKPAVAEGLDHLLTLLKCSLDRVTGVVKRALQSHSIHASASGDHVTKNKRIQTEEAEQLLLLHKPLTELQGLCVQLLCDEQEISELALACLSLLIQLYGGDHPDTMTHRNMDSLAKALGQAHTKTQRIILKLIKRVVSLNDFHGEQLSMKEGANLLKAIEACTKNPDITTSSLVNDITSCMKPRSSRS
uniref:Serine/threonine-protein kinase ULK4-like n=1 Tax=Phallusia mammillata TaxID=59560 RepID=A0A6F9DWV3_9ASCI|nr:serine/threonine-protein kinase ULK4-like [Phallusia mammillata]